MKTPTKLRLNVASLARLLLAVRAPAQPLSAIDKNTVIATLHAEVAQIYECKPDTSKPVAQARAPTWQFREPIATLMVAGQSVGRHYAGPSWDLVDGGAVKGRMGRSTLALFCGRSLKWFTTVTSGLWPRRSRCYPFQASFRRRQNVPQVYFHCSNPKEVLIDRRGAVVDDLAEARDQAACVVRSLTTARSLEDWRGWALHVNDDLGDELFVVPFAFVLGTPH